MAQKMLKQKNAEKKARKAAADASDDGSSTGKAGSNDTFRGGKTEADKINLGTELNKGQTEVANGLMDKLGIWDTKNRRDIEQEIVVLRIRIESIIPSTKLRIRMKHQYDVVNT